MLLMRCALFLFSRCRSVSFVPGQTQGVGRDVSGPLPRLCAHVPADQLAGRVARLLGGLAASRRAEPNGRGVHIAEQIGDGEVVARDGAGQLVIGDAGQHIDHAPAGRR
jgi:hypothetical protein